MMKENKIRGILNAGGTTVATRMCSTWPTLTEACASTGNFDYIEFVAEYSPFTMLEMENLVRACELHDIGSIIKVDFPVSYTHLTKQVCVGIYGFQDAGQYQQELNVLMGRCARIQQIDTVVCGNGPVIVLTGTIHACEGLLMKQALQTMTAGYHFPVSYTHLKRRRSGGRRFRGLHAPDQVRAEKGPGSEPAGYRLRQ